MTCSIDLRFPAGGTNSFKFVCQRYESATLSYVAQDISTASEVLAYVVNRSQPSVELAVTPCSDAFIDSDWSNGVVTGEFDNSVTSLITQYGYANIVIRVTIGGEPEFYFSDDKAILVVSTP